MNKLTRYITRLTLQTIPFKQHYCCLCEKKVGGFLPYHGGWKAAPPLMAALGMVGSNLDNFSCPVCLSHDRERHLWLYLQASHLLPIMQNAEILHFAPELHLSRRIIALKPKRYIKADLYPTASDIQTVNLLAMPFENATFDVLIANHVLEHVENDRLALAEIIRVLKPNGWAILQTPYASHLEKTWEDAGVQTDQQRLLAYGQEDHVRLYGQDIFERITTTGLVSQIQYHAKQLGHISSHKYGINSDEPFMLFRKV
jgi:SAM-dependent methyltransferase